MISTLSGYSVMRPSYFAMSFNNNKNTKISGGEFTSIAGNQINARDMAIHYHQPEESSKRGRDASLDSVDASLSVDAGGTLREPTSPGPPKKKGRTDNDTTLQSNEAISTTMIHMRDNITASNVQIHHTYMVSDSLTQSNIGTSQLFSMPSAVSLPVLFKPPLPPQPEYMIGRDEEQSKVIEILLHQSPACVAILGGGGMGKTTLALMIMHNHAVANYSLIFSCKLSSLSGQSGDYMGP
ncbi:hypothetical protein H0H92_012703 [Tricholoma furcatifolium]|nr:hypothetical protein H0H92_012703 [Tricholoma furcatifolium]